MRVSTIAIAVVSFLLLTSADVGLSQAASVDEVMLYNKPDRAKILVAGAPVDWTPLEPASATINTISAVTRSPHPHAAMLLLDFILSEEGQKVFQAVNYLPSHPKIPAKQADLKPGGGKFKRALYFTPDAQVNEGDAWVDYFEKTFLK